MRNILSFLFTIILFSSQLLAQEKTLVGNGDIDHGGFGAPVIKYTQIYDEPSLLVGGRGGWIINHTFVIGGGGYGLVNEIQSDFQIGNVPTYIHFGYGGLELEYIGLSDQLIHFSVYTLIGAGGVNLSDNFYEDWDDHHYGSDSFFVINPEVNIEINIVSFFRINAGAGYRFISGIDSDTLQNEDFSGFSAALTLKFGSF